MDKTPNYQLSQWVKSDQVRMEDFNADNAKIDAAIKAVDGKASGKADAAVVDGLSGTVAGHTSALAKRGNCQIYTTSYVGNGKYGQSAPTALTFPDKPLLVIIAQSDYGASMVMLQGATHVMHTEGNRGTCHPSWYGNTVSWFSGDNTLIQLSEEGKTYRVVAFFAKD